MVGPINVIYIYSNVEKDRLKGKTITPLIKYKHHTFKGTTGSGTVKTPLNLELT